MFSLSILNKKLFKPTQHNTTINKNHAPITVSFYHFGTLGGLTLQMRLEMSRYIAFHTGTSFTIGPTAFEWSRSGMNQHMSPQRSGSSQ